MNKILNFIDVVFDSNDKKAVIAVSGGIDSAVCLHLLTKELGKDRVIAVLLPYGNQDMKDAYNECDLLGVTPLTINIKKSVDSFGVTDNHRKGNVMARVRMIYQYDLAKQFDALVCGTENLSEYYLGYFTLFGDQACDFSPIAHLTKSQVRKLAKDLGVSQAIIDKAPSAGLWKNQKDEDELGFTYEEADKHITKEAYIQKVQDRINLTQFKREIPYKVGT